MQSNISTINSQILFGSLEVKKARQKSGFGPCPGQNKSIWEVTVPSEAQHRCFLCLTMTYNLPIHSRMCITQMAYRMDKYEKPVLMGLQEFFSTKFDLKL